MTSGGEISTQRLRARASAAKYREKRVQISFIYLLYCANSSTSKLFRNRAKIRAADTLRRAEYVHI